MELTATQLIDSTLNEVQKAEYLSLKSKEDNFDGLSQEEQIRFNEFKKMLTKAKSTQHIIPLKEEFKKVFPQVASHFNSDETKAIIAKVVANITPAQLLEAVIQKNIITTEDGVEKNIGKTSGFAIKDLNKAIKGFTGGATDVESKAITVGTFQLADYPEFTDDKKEGTEFTWEMNGVKYGPSWKQRFINHLVGKDSKADTFGGVDALEKLLPKLDAGFLAWLEVSKEGSGPAKGKQIFENKRAFFKLFGLNENKQPLKNVKFAEVKPEEVKPSKAAAKK